MSSDRQIGSRSASSAARLRERLAAGRLTVPSCYDALGFRMIARAGFPAAFLSGFSVSAARLGVPDAGLLSFGEMAAQVRDVAAAAAIPLLVDADTGFGNAQNVQRTVRGFVAAGAACLMLEDQEAPKRDFGAPGRVVSREEARRRVKAAVRAREAGADVLIIGRTDARNAAGPASGLDEALWRARAFADLGADLVFVTGPNDERELERVRHAARVPQIVQVDEPGRGPLAPARVHALGFEVALYGITLVLAAAAAFRDALAAMAAGLSLPPERAATFGEIGDIVGVRDYLAVERDLEGG
jgi:2-methylisocitrate lyase-like PEP mutase family enzyme